jgi:hypothetical protein
VTNPDSRHFSFRVIDWYRATTLTVTPLILAFFIGLWLRDEANFSIWRSLSSPTFAEILLAAIVMLGLWLATVHFQGTIFDVADDALSFPTLLFRRSVRLSEIRDANVANLTRRFRMLNLALAGGGKGPTTRTSTQRIYAVDMSGDFGGRQVKFWSRKRRDQFLSNLRHLCPKCRITRWAGGYGEY